MRGWLPDRTTHLLWGLNVTVWPAGLSLPASAQSRTHGDPSASDPLALALHAPQSSPVLTGAFPSAPAQD